jgi:1,4-dihydroxy-2-naphthoate polyprenyltransferase
MSSNSSLPKTLYAWWLAIRPKTLPASMAGVITGTAIAIHLDSFQLGPALAAFAVGVLLQISSNLANDVFDYEKGTDTPERVGPTRVTQAGLLTPRQVKTGLGIVVFIAALLGIYLASVAGWQVLLIGLAAIIAAVLYTAGPFPLGYHGLGDLFVFLFFGLAAVTGTIYVQARQVPLVGWGMAIPVGLLVVNLLVVNNLRDTYTDQKAGKFTLAIWLGEKRTRQEYILLQLISFGLIPLFVMISWLPIWTFLTWLAIPFAIKAAKIVYSKLGTQLNPALGLTSQLACLYSILFLMGILVSRLL